LRGNCFGCLGVNQWKIAFAIDRVIINEFMLSMTSAGRLKASLTQSMVQDADKYHGSGQAKWFDKL
jgi:hypothetical protein